MNCITFKKFINQDFSKSDFKNTIFKDVIFQDCNLEFANFKDSNFINTQFKNCLFLRNSFENVTMTKVDFSESCIFEEICLLNAKIHSTKIPKELIRADFGRSKIFNTDFVKNKVVDCRFGYAQLKNVIFKDIKFLKTDI